MFSFFRDVLINYHGPHTDDFYLSTETNVSIFSPTESTEGDVEGSYGDTKCSTDAFLLHTTPKMRATLDYKEKDSNEFKVFGNLYSACHYANDMEGNNIDFSSLHVINRGCGRPVRVPKHRTTVTVQRRCQELKEMLEIGNRVTATYDRPSQ
jgi:hypothetical protein